MNETEPAIINSEMPSKVSPEAVVAESLTNGGGGVDFSPAALRAKYVAEKEKRVHNGGSSQYHVVDVSKDDRYDPYADPGFTRDPITAVFDVVVVGGGFTALQTAARLVEHGYNNIGIFERGGDFGGTWYWNRYPGAQCDIESYIYMPLIEELQNIPTEKYAKGPELLAHALAIAEKYSLRKHAYFQTIIEKIEWNDAESMWTVSTDRNDNVKARWVVSAPGPLQGPKFPGVPGINDFKGKSFHTSRWDYEETGGSPASPELTRLADKRVGIIGTGATGIQVVPHLGRWAKDLYVFQRTPSSVDVRNNAPTDYAWAKTLASGWQRKRQENFAIIIAGGNADEDLVADGWTDIIRSLNINMSDKAKYDTDGSSGTMAVAAKLQLADYKKMESIRARVDNIVKNRKTAEGLKPWYNQWCKRPCFHDEYLDTFNRPSVHLVHTDGKGVERVTEKGIVVAGEEIELDCIVYATGFEFNNLDFSRSPLAMKIIGRDGVVLTDKWKDGAVTYHGWSGHDFPNFMLITPLQGGGNPNYTHNSGEMALHLIYLLDECKRRGIKSMEATAEAEEGWVKEVVETQGARNDFLKDCTPGYYNDEGKVNEVTIRNQPYGKGPHVYLSIIKEWREENKLEGMALQYHGDVAAQG